MEQMFSVTQLATRLHVCELTIRRWIRDGKLEYVELSPRRRLISESAIEKFLNSKIVAPPKKVVDQGQASESKSGTNGSLTTRSGGEMNVESFKQLKREISQCRFK